MKNSPDAVGKLTGWADTLAGGQPVRFVIEDGRGLASHFATALVLAGHLVSWVPVRLMKAERRLLGERGKSDPIDALATALAALNPDNAKFLAPHSADEVGRNVGYLVDQRRDRVNARTRLINTLRWRLHFYDPHLVPGSLITLTGPRKLAAALAERPAGELRDVLIRDCHVQPGRRHRLYVRLTDAGRAALATAAERAGTTPTGYCAEAALAAAGATGAGPEVEWEELREVVAELFAVRTAVGRVRH